jgi:hypothetical protein
MMAHPKYKRRLLKLADFIWSKQHKVPRQRFYYGSWVGEDWKGSPTLDCGTTACALGWAATMPTFRRLGLRLTPFVIDDEITVNETLESRGAEVFGLSLNEFDALFVPGGEYNPLRARATPKQVADRIRAFVAHPEDFLEREWQKAHGD